MDYYSPFWGPEVISIVVEPQGALTCLSSTLAVFVNSDPFRGLLLTVLCPKAISVVVEPQCALMCWSSTIAVLTDYVLLHGLVLTDLGSLSDFHD